MMRFDQAIKVILVLFTVLLSTSVFGVDRIVSRGFGTSERPSLTVFGIDAAEWEALEYLAKEGYIPNISRYISEGTSGKLESFYPLFSPMVWTTIATGKSPLQHGIQGFKALNPKTGNKVPVNRTMRRVKAFWNILSKKGKSSLSVAWYATWPAERIRGTMISDYTWPLKNQRKTENFLEEEIGMQMKDQTYPRYMYKKVKRFFVDKHEDNDKFTKRFGIKVADAPYCMKHSYAKDLTYFRIFQHLRKKQRYDLSTIYIQGPDLLAHKFYVEFHALVEGKLKPGTEAHKKAMHIVNYYRFVDDMLGVYERKVRRPNETIMLVSDHGFEDRGKKILTKVSDERFAKKRSWHRKHGAFIMHGASVPSGVKVKGVTVFDITPTILSFFDIPVAKDMQGKPISKILKGMGRKSYKRIATYERKKRKRVFHEESSDTNVDIKESAYDQAILKSLSELGYLQ